MAPEKCKMLVSCLFCAVMSGCMSEEVELTRICYQPTGKRIMTDGISKGMSYYATRPDGTRIESRWPLGVVSPGLALDGDKTVICEDVPVTTEGGGRDGKDD